jgi:hypothetical protein
MSLDGQETIVYGRLVNDFKVIDYGQMFAVCMGSMQRMIEKIMMLEEKLGGCA